MGGRFVRTLLVLLALWAAPASAQFSGTLSGSWWDAARAGEGQFILFERVGTRNVVTFAYFTYTGAGAATWLVGNVDYPTGATSITVPLIVGSGPVFGSGFRSSDFRSTPAGTAVLEYVSCAQMRMVFTGAGSFAQSYTLTLTRVVGELAGTPCATQQANQLDLALRPLLPAFNQTGNAAAGRNLPAIEQPLPQLGKLLFFSKALSGNLDTACASCHHPALGGGDALSLSIGTGASQPDVMGAGRRLSTGGFSVGRNSNTFFNVGLLDKGMFWDSRVESLGKVARANGAGSGIRTPDSPLDIADPAAGPNLPAAQARFPVVSATEMKGTNALADPAFRSHLAARLGNYGSGAGQLGSTQWLERFRAAFGQGTAEQLVTFDNVAAAIAAYQRSATFVDSPWAAYVRGDNAAISDAAKRGALLFFRTPQQGGAACSACHTGDTFTNERHHALGFPQVGPGKADGTPANDDFGRGRETASARRRCSTSSSPRPTATPASTPTCRW
jgi:cytochrome c peroxidase